MPRRYPPLKRREIIAILKSLGFSFSHSRGSHEYWQKASAQTTYTVTVDDYQEFTDRILVYMIQQSGMNREQFYGATTRTARKIE